MVKLSDLIHWVKSKIGFIVDFDGFYGAQCVDLIMAYIYTFFKFKTWGNAIQYTSNQLPPGFKRYKKGQIQIRPGDIIVWNMTLPWGHIGICIGINGNMLTMVEQNVDGNVDALTVGGPARIVHRNIDLVAAIIRPPYEDDYTRDTKWVRIPEEWHFTVTVDTLNVREEPTLNSKVVATYKKGDVIKYDSYLVSSGYVWISYIGGSGIRRYVATGKYINGFNNNDFGHFK